LLRGNKKVSKYTAITTAPKEGRGQEITSMLLIGLNGSNGQIQLI